MPAAARTHQEQPRERKARNKTRTLRKPGSTLKLVKKKGFVLEWRDTEGGYRSLQRTCYHLRMAHNMTQEDLATKAGMTKATIIRFEDLGQPMLAPRLKTYAKIFGRGLGLTLKLVE